MHISSSIFRFRETSHYDKMIRLLMVDGKKQKALTLFFGTVFKVAQKLPSSASLGQESENLASDAFREKPILDKDIALLNRMNLLGFLVEGISKRNLELKSLQGSMVRSEMVKNPKALALSNDRKHSIKTNESPIESTRSQNLIERHFDPQIRDPNAKTMNLQISGGAFSRNHVVDRKKAKSSIVFLVLSKALQNVMPYLEVRKVRISGKTRQIPSMIRVNRQQTLAIRWLIEAARKKQKKNGRFTDCLANEFIEAFEKQGNARQKRNELHKIAHANRTFLRYRWW